MKRRLIAICVVVFLAILTIAVVLYRTPNVPRVFDFTDPASVRPARTEQVHGNAIIVLPSGTKFECAIASITVGIIDANRSGFMFYSKEMSAKEVSVFLGDLKSRLPKFFHLSGSDASSRIEMFRNTNRVATPVTLVSDTDVGNMAVTISVTRVGLSNYVIVMSVAWR